MAEKRHLGTLYRHLQCFQLATPSPSQGEIITTTHRAVALLDQTSTSGRFSGSKKQHKAPRCSASSCAQLTVLKMRSKRRQLEERTRGERREAKQCRVSDCTMGLGLSKGERESERKRWRGRGRGRMQRLYLYASPCERALAAAKTAQSDFLSVAHTVCGSAVLKGTR